MSTPAFILRLREKIGHDPLWLVGVTACVEDGAGRILLGQRADNGNWALISGINEPGEEPADTVIREAREEAGVDVVPTALVSVKADDRMVAYANGDQVQYLDLLFICRLAEGGVSEARVNDDESLAVGWFSPDDLPEPIQPSTVERLARIRRYRERAVAGDASAYFTFSDCR